MLRTRFHILNLAGAIALSLGLVATLGAPAWAQADPLEPAPIADGSFGPVRLTPHLRPDGQLQPFQQLDCDGDGTSDLRIPTSGAPIPAALYFESALPGGQLPEAVDLVVEAGEATFRAYDADNVEVDAVTVSGDRAVQPIALIASAGIARVTIEGEQICLLSACWSAGSVSGPSFIRADANGDSSIDVGDVSRCLGVLFLGEATSCEKAVDSDDSGTLNIADAVFLLNYLFQQGATPPAPFPNCGDDSTADSLSCDTVAACPPPAPAVEECEDRPTLNVVPESGSDRAVVRLKTAVLAPKIEIDVDGIVESASDDRVHFLVQLWPTGSPADLEDFQMEVLDQVDPGLGDAGPTFVVAHTTDDVDALQLIDAVRWAGPMLPLVKLSPDLHGVELEPVVPWAIAPDGRLGLNVYFQSDIEEGLGIDILQSFGAEILGEISSLRLVQSVIEPDLVGMLAEDDRVLFIEPTLPPLEELNDVPRDEQNVDSLRRPPYSLTGNGVVAVVYDSGNVDSNHPDFDDRVIEVESPLEESKEHATHVAGTIGGSGLNSPAGGGTAYQFQGMAPEIELRTFGYGQHINPLFDNPGDLLENSRRSTPTDLVNMSLGNNVVVNGFNCTQLGVYTTTSRVVDSIVLGVPASLGDPAADPIPFVQAVGNERQGGMPCGQFGTVGSPATAKNSITVGALQPGTNGLRLASSLGPTDDGRLRPDLVATGCTTSTIPGGGYDANCGTSMASPVVAGIVALLIEDYRWLRRIDLPVTVADLPPRMIKAILIHTATDLGLPGPDFRFGWGRVNAQAAVDLIRADFIEEATTGRLIYNDTVNAGSVTVNEADLPATTGEQKFTLVWDDPLPAALAARDLVNDIDLIVTDPAGNEWRPFAPNPASPNTITPIGVDSLNNVEQVIAPAMAGVWEFRVDGSKLRPGSPQAFTLIREPSVPLDACTHEVRMSAELTPRWLSGDRDFDGHGPFMKVDGLLEVREGNELWLTMSVEADEQQPDFTFAFGAEEYLVFYDPEVSSISLTSAPFAQFETLTTGHDSQVFDFATSGLFRTLELFGDRDGPDAGLYTRVQAVLNPVEIACTAAAIPSDKRVVEVDPVFILPPSVGPGDDDFDDNGPEVSLNVELSIGGVDSNQIIATVTMDAQEQGGDGTRALITTEVTLYTHDSPIQSIDSALTDSAFYTDDDYFVDLPEPFGNAVRNFRVVGDTDGSEAGTRTSVTIDFNPIRFTQQ